MVDLGFAMRHVQQGQSSKKMTRVNLLCSLSELQKELRVV